jgi:hypothetical protein
MQKVSRLLIPDDGTIIHKIPNDLLAKTHEHLDTSTALRSNCDLAKTRAYL